MGVPGNKKAKSLILRLYSTVRVTKKNNGSTVIEICTGAAVDREGAVKFCWEKTSEVSRG